MNAYGTNNVSYSLRASVSLCPTTFDGSGTRLVCSTPVGAGAAGKGVGRWGGGGGRSASAH